MQTSDILLDALSIFSLTVNNRNTYNHATIYWIKNLIFWRLNKNKHVKILLNVNNCQTRHIISMQELKIYLLYTSQTVLIYINCVVYVFFVSIVLFCVLFVCKCVLYYCHRVSTQSQLTIYHTIYHIMYHITSRHIASHHIISYITCRIILYIIS
jgi:hypothetical protein